MASIRKLDDNTTVTTPYSYTFRGESGVVFVSEDDEILWTKLDNTSVMDVNGDSKVDLLVSGLESMANFFSLELTEAPPTLDSSLIPELSVAADLSYKTLLGSTGSHTTRINLSITNDANGSFAVQIASELSGGSLDSNGNPSTWATLARETSGLYYVTLPCNDTIPHLEPFFVRFTGNVGQRLGNYVVFRTDGTDPLEGSVTPPSTGTSRIGVDIICISWDGLEGHDYNSDNPNTPSSGNSQAEWNLQNTRRTMERAGIHAFKDSADRLIPWYGTSISDVLVPIYSNQRYGTSGWEYDVNYRTASHSFDYGQTQMNQDITYAINAGVAAWCFVYYKSNAIYSNKRILFENTPSINKGIMKMICYPEEILEQVDVDHICGQMLQSYWYKIGGRPVLVLQEGTGKSGEQASAYQAKYTALGGTNNIYFVYLGGYGYPAIVPEPFEASCIYTLGNGGNGGLRGTVQWANRNKKICPSFTTGLQNYAYRLGTHSEEKPQATYRATLEECQARLADLNTWMGETRPSGSGINKDDVPFVLAYAWNEVCEGGRPIMPTKNASTGVIEKELLDTVEYWFKKS